MAQCPQCAATLDESAATCSACGATVAGSTASFTPVGTPDSSPAPVAAFEVPALVVRKGPQPGERFYLDRERLNVGRDPESDIFLNDMTVSRAHALLETKNGVVTVSDAGSLNGTYVNGVCVESAVLSAGDVLQIGTFQMLFYDAKDAAR